MHESGSSSSPVTLRGNNKEVAWVALLAQTAVGDDHAFGRFYDETSTMVYSLAVRILENEQDAEEVTLDVFNQVWKIAKSYRTDRGSVTAWLMTLARSRSLDKLRSRRTRNQHTEPIPELFDPPADAASPEQHALGSEQRSLILQALRNLPPEQRILLDLAYFRGLSHAEMAAAVGEPLGTVKTRIRLGMKKLRELLGDSLAGPQRTEIL